MRRLAPEPRVALAAAAIAVCSTLAACGNDREDRRARASPGSETQRSAWRPAGVGAHLRALQRIARMHGGTRAAGTPGDRATSRYIAGRLSMAGYAVVRQRVSFPHFEITGRTRVAGARGELRGGRRSVRPLQYTPGGSARGRLRRIGTACTRSRAAAVRPGEIALARRGICTFRRKAALAAASGAAALLVAGRPGEPLVSASLQRPGVRIPAVLVSDAAARSLGSGERVSVRVRAISAMRNSENVIASSPRRAGRFLLLGAHSDSVPASGGLNDNGSGVAAVLDVAERLAARGTPSDRLAFGFWAAEELGLIGSRRYVRSLDAAARRSVLGYLNLDMVGSPRPRPTVYAARPKRQARRLERVLLAGLRRQGVRARVRAAGDGSDHVPFARAAIPVGGLFTGAGRPADPCYHRACDDLANVDVEMTRAMARAALWAAARIARSP